jgi:hypothetical protein
MISYVPDSWFSYLPDIYSSTQLDPGKCHSSTRISATALTASVMATAFATLSLHLRSEYMVQIGRNYYADALAKTNRALSSASDATLDSTLIAVLLLGLYETIVYFGFRPPDSWTAHTMGTLALLRLRGPSQLTTVLGRQLFHQAASAVRTSCSQQLLPVPEELAELQKPALSLFDADIKEDPRIRMVPLIDRTAAVRQLACRASPPPAVACRVLREALAIDTMLEEICISNQNHAQFVFEETACLSPAAYNGRTHRYPSVMAARHWSTLRLMRFYLNELILRTTLRIQALKLGAFSPSTDLDLPSIRIQASMNGAALSDAILASLSHFADRETGRLRSLAVRFLVWPLASIMNSSIAPETARDIAATRLAEIGVENGLPQALEAATLRRRFEPGDDALPHDWSVFLLITVIGAARDAFG